jgi:hypothetical protein
MSFGCEQKTPTLPSPQAQADKKETLEERVVKLKLELFKLQMQVTQMSSGSADVSTIDKGYSVAQTKFGSFTIVCKNVTPYLDGYKVHLSIGNLTNARFSGAKINLLWGKDYNSKEMSVTNIFYPGRYTNVEIVLTPAKPEDIKTFSVALDFNQIALLQ